MEYACMNPFRLQSVFSRIEILGCANVLHCGKERPLFMRILQRSAQACEFTETVTGKWLLWAVKASGGQVKKGKLWTGGKRLQINVIMKHCVLFEWYRFVAYRCCACSRSLTVRRYMYWYAGIT